MVSLYRSLTVSCLTALVWSGAAQSHYVYGDIIADGVANVGTLDGQDPPANHNPATNWPWLQPCTAALTTNCMHDSGPALQKAIDSVPMYGTLRFQHCRYLTMQTLEVNRPITVQFTNSDDRVSRCGLEVWPGTNSDGTLKTAIVGIKINGPMGSDASALRGLYLYAAPAAHSDNAYGILMTSTAQLAGVTVENFEGDGIRIDASSNNTKTPAAANQWRIDGGAALNNKGYGLFVRGYDVNAGVAVRFDSIGNAKGNYRDSSFLGNTYIACHSDRNHLNGAVVPDTSYQSGYSDDARTQQIASNRSLFLNSYEEDGQYADLGANSMWLGGQGAAVVRGQGSVLKTNSMGFWSHHFLAATTKPVAPPASQLPQGQQSWAEGDPDPVARIGNGPLSVDTSGHPISDNSLGQWWLPTEPGIRQDKKPTLFLYPSRYRDSNIDLAYNPSAGRYAAALSLSTAGAQTPPVGPAMEAPGSARLGQAWVFAAGQKPQTTCAIGDLAINVGAAPVWAWQCDGPSHWRELLVSPHSPTP